MLPFSTRRSTTGSDPFRAPQACRKGFLSAAFVVSESDPFVCSTGSLTVFTLSHKKTKSNASSDVSGRGLTSMPWRES